MISFHLFSIVFTILQLHLTCGKNGLATRLPLMKQLGLETRGGRMNSTSINTQERDFQSWRRRNDGISIDEANQTHREKPATSQINQVRFATEFKSGIYGTKNRRPIQQLFYNIYIQDSPSIKVKNIIHMGAIPTKWTSNPLRYGITNETDNTADNYSDDVPFSRKSESSGVSSTAAEKKFIELNRSLNKTEDGKVVLLADEEAMMLDAVKSELINRNRENKTGGNPASKQHIKSKLDNISSRSQGENGTRRNLGLPSDDKRVADIPIGNIWRAFRPNSLSVNEEITDETGDSQDDINRKSQIRYSTGIQNGHHGTSGYVMQISHSTSLNDSATRDFSLAKSLQEKVNVTGLETPVAAVDESFADPRAYVSNDQRRLEYPAYGSHSYSEILRKLYELKAGKKEIEKNAQDRVAHEHKMAVSETQKTF